MANVKHGVHNDGSDTPDNRCESKDNGQCRVSPTAQESINKSSVQAYGPKRCENVVEKSVNNKRSFKQMA